MNAKLRPTWDLALIAGTALVVSVVLVAVISPRNENTLAFENLTPGSVATVLTALFIIAVFLERTLEVFISVWREAGRNEREIARTTARENLRKVMETHAITGNQIRPFQEKLQEAENTLNRYQNSTRRYSMLFLFFAGIAVSLVGIRSIDPLVADVPACTAEEICWFAIADVIVTAGLIAGGSEGIHRLMMVVIDFLDATRLRLGQSTAATDPGISSTGRTARDGTLTDARSTS